MVVVWSNQAEAALKKLYEYISEDSAQNAQKIIVEIITAVGKLSEYPEMFPLDKFKKDNDGTWRAFEKYHYRISYRVAKSNIRIVRLRHTGRNPLKY